MVRQDANLSRRRFIVTVAGASFSAALTPVVRTAGAAAAVKIHRPLDPDDLTDREKKLVPRVDLPAMADNQGTVPIRILVDHVMTDKDYVEWIEIRDDKAVFKRKARFYFTPANGRAYLQTNIKVPNSTSIKVRAKFSRDGIWESEKDIKVPGGSRYSC
jgi:desulfoferrodoxin (superoxide reductase-like protein)